MRGFDPGPWAQAVWLHTTDRCGPALWFYPDGVRVDAAGCIELDLHGQLRWQGAAADQQAYRALACGCGDDADRLAAQTRRAIERWAGTLCAADERLRRLLRLRDMVLREIELLRLAEPAAADVTPSTGPAVR